MIAILLGFACTLGDDPASDDSAGTSPGTAVAFDEVLWGEAGGNWKSGDTEEPCVTAHVEALSSDAELESLSWLGHWDVPSVDWKTESMLVAYIDMCTNGGNDLEMTGVWDTGGGTLQVDLTFHRGQIGTANIARPFSIATVAHGDYVATANVTVSYDDTGFGSRD